jgi:RimJ/RimL family protein N-acetyltransferase
VIGTPRLVLCPWREEDLAPFAELGADPEVAGDYPGPMDRAASDALVGAIRGRCAAEDWGYGPIERRADGAFLGMAGLSRCDFGPPLGPCLEIGWRLGRAHWERGCATEAAQGWLGFAFETLGLAEGVAFMEPANARSAAVMRRLGMTRDPGRDFDLPDLPPGHPVRRQALHALTREGWRAAMAEGAPIGLGPL